MTGTRQDRRPEAVDLAIVIVNYRSWGHCAEALESIVRYPPRAGGVVSGGHEVVVIDNGSPPPVPEVQARFDRALRAANGRLIVNADNAGYARAANHGLAETKSRYVIVSNPDVVFRERTLDSLVEFLHGHDDVGAAGPEIFWDDALTCRMPDNFLPSAGHELYELFMRASPLLERWSARRTLRRQLALWSAEGPTDVQMLSGCCLAFRRDVLERVGPFDENFTLYLEDADLAKRLREHGKRLVVVKSAKLVHKFSQSVGLDPEAAMAKYWTSLAYYHDKWSGWFGTHVGKLYRVLTRRWYLAQARSAPAPRWTVEIESHEKPQLVLPRHCDRFCVQVSLEPSFQAMCGVLGEGSGWTPDDSLFGRFGYRTWLRVFDLSTARVELLAEYRLTRRAAPRRRASHSGAREPR